MIRERILIWLTNTSLSLKLQMDCALTVIKAIDTIRQNETVKKEQGVSAMLMLCRDNVQENLTSAQPKESKTWTKVQNGKQMKSQRRSMIVAENHQKSVCPACDIACFK
jgi:hypothetical protein